MEILQRMYGELTVLPPAVFSIWNRDIFLETACIESKISSLSLLNKLSPVLD